MTKSRHHMTTLVGSEVNVVNGMQVCGNGECRERRRNANATQDTLRPSAHGLSQDSGERNETLDATEHTGSATDNTIRRWNRTDGARLRMRKGDENFGFREIRKRGGLDSFYMAKTTILCTVDS